MNHSKIQINEGGSSRAVLRYLNRLDKKSKSKYKKEKKYRVKNSLWQPAKNYEKFKKETTFKKNLKII